MVSGLEWNQIRLGYHVVFWGDHEVHPRRDPHSALNACARQRSCFIGNAPRPIREWPIAMKCFEPTFGIQSISAKMRNDYVLVAMTAHLAGVLNDLFDGVFFQYGFG